MATNEKWEPPYSAGQTEIGGKQTSDTVATQITGATNEFDDLTVSNDGEDGSGELRIVLIGKTGTGKSSTGNSLIGEKVFECKGSAKSVTSQCTVVQKERFGKTLVVVDTPGFLDTNMSTEKLREELVSCHCFTYPGIHALLLVFQVGHRYNDEDERAIKLMKELFCENFVNRTVVVLTGKDTLEADEQTLADYISELPEELKKTIESCKGGVIAISNRGEQREEAAKDIISKVEEIVEENGGESQYYKTVLSVEISRMIAENIKKILKANFKINEKIKLIKQEMEKLSGDDSRIQQKRKEFERIIDDLTKKLINRRTALEKAKENTRNKFKDRLKNVWKIVSFVAGILVVVALVIRKFII